MFDSTHLFVIVFAVVVVVFLLKTNINIFIFFIISFNLKPVTHFSANKHSPS